MQRFAPGACARFATRHQHPPRLISYANHTSVDHDASAIATPTGEAVSACWAVDMTLCCRRAWMTPAALPTCPPLPTTTSAPGNLISEAANHHSGRTKIWGITGCANFVGGSAMEVRGLHTASQITVGRRINRISTVPRGVATESRRQAAETNDGCNCRGATSWQAERYWWPVPRLVWPRVRLSARLSTPVQSVPRWQ